ncbi:hypothetical protein Plhal304r1_c061g0148621 [Plasmopara halstedii]
MRLKKAYSISGLSQYQPHPVTLEVSRRDILSDLFHGNRPRESSPSPPRLDAKRCRGEVSGAANSTGLRQTSIEVKGIQSLQVPM